MKRMGGMRERKGENDVSVKAFVGGWGISNKL